VDYVWLVVETLYGLLFVAGTYSNKVKDNSVHANPFEGGVLRGTVRFPFCLMSRERQTKIVSDLITYGRHEGIVRISALYAVVLRTYAVVAGTALM
jgi:hypothetical protein